MNIRDEIRAAISHCPDPAMRADALARFEEINQEHQARGAEIVRLKNERDNALMHKAGEAERSAIRAKQEMHEAATLARSALPNLIQTARAINAAIAAAELVAKANPTQTEV